ncbi:nucleoside triphosphate pyrophosphohydrolase family protein [Kordiimonas aquimaris]|uniref:nucleoside triphosphate pyrophosphohydrolase family protein n=1 Tax=Kordiimonas aquimaris TaxID=707591 RepID=UPI0021D20D85|nr:nucleoside triphosphate pyrophosphohydrolase family protein [Kordiimonas aquimaris]
MDRKTLEFDEYQQKARDTNRIPYSKESAEGLTEDIIPLLGLAGEAGDLLTEYKKRLRDGDAYVVFRDRVKEELGDIIWYVSNFADRFDLKLSEIIHYNLHKTFERFNDTCSIDALDVDLIEDRRFPQSFEIEFREIELDGHKKIQMRINGNELPPETNVGAALTDNAYSDDGYKFHDAMHLAFVAVLGWSPVMRKLLKEAKVIKSAREARIDEVEDGGRAKVIDEGLVALIFTYASQRNFLVGIDTIDYSLLRMIKEMRCP